MIADFLHKNPRILLLIVGVIVVAGGSAIELLPRLEDPVLSKRVGVVTTAFPGADSQRVESLVSMRLTERLHGIAEIHEIRSTSRTGVSSLVVELEDEVSDVNAVWTLVRDRLTGVEEVLPEGCLSPALDVIPLKAFAAIVSVKLQDPNTDLSLLRRHARNLGERIRNLPGTESIGMFGNPGEEFAVRIPATTLYSTGLSTGAIAQQIASTNATQPAGFLRGEGPELLVDVDAGYRTIQDIEEKRVRFGAETVGLGEIAEIERAVATPQAQWALSDGRQAIVLGALIDDQRRVDRWAATFEKAIEDYQSRYANDVEIDVIFSQNHFIRQRLYSLWGNLQLGGVAVVAVVLLLMGWRSMIVVGAALPLSALMVLAGMRALGIPMHQMSITGLIVALGLLIDNAIVIVEDVRSRIVQGQQISLAIRKGIRHLWMPLFGSTLTTTLAFMPIATLPGPPGEFVGTIAVSVILAISSSFLLSMTVVPALLGFMNVEKTTNHLLSYGISSQRMTRLYRWSLGVVFRFPFLGVGIGIVLPALGFVVAQNLPVQFFPPSDRHQIQIEIELQARESMDKTIQTVLAMNQSLDEPSIDRLHWFVGGSAPTFYYNVVPRRRAAPYYAQGMVELHARVDVDDSVREIQRQLDERFPECRVIVRRLEQGPPFDAPIEMRVVGPSDGQRRKIARQLRYLLSQTPHVIHTRSDALETIPKIRVELDQTSAVQSSVSDKQLAQFMYATLEGAPAGEVLDGVEEIPIKIRVADSDSGRLNRLAALPIATATVESQSRQTGTPQTPPVAVPVAAIAKFRLAAEPAAKTRINGEPTTEVKAYLEAGVLPSIALNDFKQRLEDSGFQLPPGYSFEFGGERAERSSAVATLAANATVLFALMVLSLVVSFRSFRSALIILSVGGLAIGLGPLALWLTGFPFGFMAIVGTMGLVGIAINDSIVVLAALSEHDAVGKKEVSAMVDVVCGCTRHVVTTTLTTLFGFMPLILGGGDFWPPLAICIAMGVAGATILAIYFVPSMKLLLFGRPRSSRHSEGQAARVK